MRRKLRSSQGETLVEVLASIVVCSLSVLLLFGAVGASASIDLTAQAADKQYYEDLSKAERQDAADACPPPAGTTLKIVNAEGAEAEPAVAFYGTERLLSYAAAGGGP